MLTVKQIESMGLRVISAYVDGNGTETFTVEALEDPDFMAKLSRLLDVAARFDRLLKPKGDVK